MLLMQSVPLPSHAGATTMSETEFARFFSQPAPALAADLIGTTLMFDGAGGIIVETEAYDPDDPASHAARGQTRRNASMFGPPGRAYVYRSYGIHWCLNMVCGDRAGSAVLIRALQPAEGLDVMRQRRGTSDIRLLCNGPGRLCQALGITGTLDGKPLDAPPFWISRGTEPVETAAGRRIGLTRAVETPWRFVLAGSRFLSRPMAAL